MSSLFSRTRFLQFKSKAYLWATAEVILRMYLHLYLCPCSTFLLPFFPLRAICLLPRNVTFFNLLNLIQVELEEDLYVTLFCFVCLMKLGINRNTVFSSLVFLESFGPGTQGPAAQQGRQRDYNLQHNYLVRNRKQETVLCNAKPDFFLTSPKNKTKVWGSVMH